MKSIVLIFVIFFSLFAHASKGGGNGQLVVIPKGHTKPVPYEAVRAWETGFYLNFHKLPGMKGVYEPRAKFNKKYGTYAYPWIYLAQNLSNKISNKLEKAMYSTSFRIINGYIAWAKKDEENGKLDYKKYEKAAFFNGDIVLSIPTLERVGPLKGYLSKEENIGLIVFKMLLSAAYQDLYDEDIERILEALVRVKIYGDSKEDFLYYTSSISLDFLEIDEDSSFTNLVEQLINYSNNSTRTEELKDILEIYDGYIRNPQSIKMSFLDRVLSIPFVTPRKIEKEISKLVKAYKTLGLEMKVPLFDLETLKIILEKTSTIAPHMLMKIKEPVSKKDFQTEGFKYINREIRNELFKSLDSGIEKYSKIEGVQKTVYRWSKSYFESDFDYRTIENMFSEEFSQKWTLKLYFLQHSLQGIIEEEKDKFQEAIVSAYEKVLKTKGYEIDRIHTKEVFAWTEMMKSNPSYKGEIPLKRSAKYFYITADGKTAEKIDVLKVNNSKVVIRFENGRKNIYTYEKYSRKHFPININIGRGLFIAYK